MSDLDRLAERVGIEPFYHDIWGNRRETSRETQVALISAMGLDVGSDEAIAQSLRTVEERPWRTMLPPVLVLDENAQLSVPVSAPAGLEDATLIWTLAEEGGAEQRGEAGFGSLAVAATATLDGLAFERRTLALPRRLPLGYHTLTVEVRPRGLGGALSGAVRLIVAPERCVMPQDVMPGGRTWGIGAQVYSLKSADDWGMGDFDDLARFAEAAGGLGAGLVGLNPLHALFPADPQHFGPYSPSSRTFLNVLYIDVEAVPDLADAPAAREAIAQEAFQRDLAAARAAELVDYPAVARLKLPVLRTLHAYFRANHLREGDVSPRGQAFRAFQREMGEDLRRHALFDALHEHFYTADPNRWEWQTWPEEYRSPDSSAVADFARDHAERVEFFEYLQWEADRQLEQAAIRGKKAGLALGFYRDLAVAGHPGGAASWADPKVLVQGANVGAPPDQFNMKGQNWGLAPFSPVALREAAYEPFIRMVRANMRHAGALRIDHVMALKHLFWIPSNGGDGAYVEYPFEDLVRIIALESRRQTCIVIGEDLGTVPEGFRPAMQAAGILSYRVLYFERAPDGGFLPPAGYPADAMVTITTHDLATFKGFWSGHDLEWRTRLDLYPSKEAQDKDAWDRGVDRWRLLQALAREGVKPASYPTDDGGQPYSRELVEAVHRYLATTAGRIVMVQIEDALGEIEQPNLPGTIDQHPNWRRRLGRTVEEIAADSGVRSLAAAVTAARGAP
ncbi:4-alpha-glucanotransferase [Azospirillum sp.]|uniref:4-alpha-glucanotransferase n=1 Tax=Azospirillum sp. TaxID=34012 RepID=UPI003D7309F5